MNHFLKLTFCLLLLAGRGHARDSENTAVVDSSADSSTDSVELQMLIDHYEEAYKMDSLLHYQRGDVELADGLATLSLDTGFKYLDPAEANKILVDAWGNPEQEILGMIFPDSINPYLYNGWGVVIYYVEDGHIKDDDAKDINYDKLLKSMQEDAVTESNSRREYGYAGYELIGWADPPYYDEEAKKLCWAKELKFDDSEEHTLNYDIRVLGRRGYLQLNAVAGIEQLADVKISMQDLLSRVAFNQGNTYFDFDPSVDQVAAYGIGALVAGKLAAKAGVIKLVGIFLAKFWKFILLGLVAIGAFIRKVWGGKEKRELT